MVQVIFKKRDFKYNKAKNASVLKDLNFSSHNASKKQKVFEVLKSVSEGGVRGDEVASAAGFLRKKGLLSKKDTGEFIATMREAGYKGRNYSYKNMDKFETADSPKKTASPNPAAAPAGRLYGQRTAPLKTSTAPVSRGNDSVKVIPARANMQGLSPSFTKKF